MNCNEASISLGAYLLGALEPAEGAEVDGHLAGCPSCRHELSDLAGLPSVLGRLTLEDLNEGVDSGAGIDLPTPPDGLFERVAARAREEEMVVRRASFGGRQRVLAAAAAAVVIAGVVAGGVALNHHGRPAAQTFSHRAGPVLMSVDVDSQASGTWLHVTVSGVDREEHCTLVAVDDRGRSQVAGQWDATYSGTAEFTGSTGIPLSRLSALRLLGTNGAVLDAVKTSARR